MKKRFVILVITYALWVSPAFAQAEVLFDLASELLINLFQNQDQIKQGDGFMDDTSISKRTAESTGATQAPQDKTVQQTQSPQGNPTPKMQVPAE